MTRKDLIERIKRHQAQCSRVLNTSFGVAAVVELADGVLAIRETDGEHTIYFDKSKCHVRDGAIEDIGHKIRNFPADTGFIEDVMSRNWQDMTQTAKMGLEASGRSKIKWHKKPVSIKY